MGTDPQKVVAVNGLSLPVTDSRFSDLMYPVAKDVNDRVAMDDTADLLGRCASITNMSKFRASTFGCV